MFDPIFEDVRSGKRTARIVSGVTLLLTLGLLVAVVAMPGPWRSDLRIVTGLLAGLTGFLTVVLGVSGMRSVASHPLVHKLQSDPADVIGMDLTHIHRNGMHLRTRIDLRCETGKTVSVEVDKLTAEKWVDLLQQGLPNLAAA